MAGSADRMKPRRNRAQYFHPDPRRTVATVRFMDPNSNDRR